MKTVRKRMIIGMFIIIGIMICSCGMKKNNSDESKDITLKSKPELVLNERQKEILEEVGLPTDAEELDSSQQEAIIAIDEMLTEIEKKYNTSFSYAGYIAPGPLEHEQLIAYPTEGSSRDTFTVTRGKENGKYVYEDEYMNVAIRKDFSSYMTDLARQVFKTEAVKVYAEVTETTLVEVPSEEKMYNGAVGSKNYIYIDSEYINQQDFQSYVDELEKMLYQNELYGISEIILLKNDEIENLDEYNYSYYDISDSYIEWKEISVQRYES